MKITLFPSLGVEPISASVKGDIITINGEVVDLSGIPEGYSLPGGAVGNKYFVIHVPVTRVNGELSFSLIMPVYEETDEKWRNPTEPNVLHVTSGVVPFPDTMPPIPEASEPNPLPEEPEDGGLEPA